MGTIVPYNIAFVGVVVTTVLLGIGPGLLSVLLSDLMVEAFILGSFRSFPAMFDGSTLVRLATSIAIGIFVCCVLHVIRVAQIKARKSETRLAAFAAAAFEGIVESLSGRIVDCNEQFAQMTGRTVAELRGMAVADLVAPEDRAQVMANVAANRESAIEHAMLRKDGMRLIVETRGRPVSPGSPMRHTALRDITDRKRAEDALRESEQHRKAGRGHASRAATIRGSLRRASQYARSLIEASLDPFVTISAEGKITDVNEATIRATGVSREDLIGTDFATYFTEPDKARAGYRHVFAEGHVTDYPLTIRHRDGRLIDVLYNATLYKDGSGNVLGVFAAARDVTERKRAEEELKKYRDQLEELVRERTAQLSEAAAQAQQLAAEAFQAAEAVRQLSLFPEQNPNPVLRIARDGTILFANPVSGPLLDYWGLAVEKRLPDDWTRQLAEIIDAAVPVEREVECAGKVFSCVLAPVVTEGYVNVFGRDVTDRKRREEQLAKLTRLYAVLSQVNEAIVRSHESQPLYDEVCRIVAEKGEFPLAWIGQRDAGKVVPVACVGPGRRLRERDQGRNRRRVRHRPHWHLHPRKPGRRQRRFRKQPRGRPLAPACLAVRFSGVGCVPAPPPG